MISGIKIYKGDGTLKQEINQAEARELYNETNKSAWELSPTERRHWDNMTVKETQPYEYKGLRPWIKRSYKWNKQYKLKCIMCKKEMIKANSKALICSTTCKNAHLREERKNK